METIMETKNLNRSFNLGKEVIQALKEINIEIKKSSLTVLKGPSGSGKTTLMNLLGALDKPTSGEIFFNGREITNLSERKRDLIRRDQIGFIFQSVALDSYMTALENVEFGLKIAKYDTERVRERAKSCLELVGLADRRDHYSYELSGGEKQRVEIARAIAHKPEIIFADEPTAELDTELSLQMLKLFKRLIDKEEVTIVMSTHDSNLMQFADIMYALQDGVVIDDNL